MNAPMRTPRQYHAAEHLGAFEDCGRCARAAGRCRQKNRLADRTEADAWVTEYHESREYAQPWQRHYCCRWCNALHTATIRSHDRVAWDRVEKQRRKWLAAKEVQRRDHTDA
jgi:hypothetical protein